MISIKNEVRGYNKDEVNEFLDDVIKDYEPMLLLVKEQAKKTPAVKILPVQETSAKISDGNVLMQEWQVTTATNFW